MGRKIWTWALMSLIMAGLIMGNGGCKLLWPSGSDASGGAITEEQRVLNYLGREIILPVRVEKIVVTGALEALEDLLMLGVKPVGVMTIGGKFPDIFAEITADARGIGERVQPSMEAILKLAPDVILSSDKFPAPTAAKLEKLAPTVPISHYPADGPASLLFLGELTGTKERAEAVLARYRQELITAKKRLPETVKGQKIMAIRIRAGSICVYPADLFFNEILYGELGLRVPQELEKVKSQEIISLEKFSEIDPDYIFLQYESSESRSHPRVLEELRQNPIWRSVKAVKTDRVFVNVVDPLIQGVAVGGKIEFLKAAIPKLVP